MAFWAMAMFFAALLGTILTGAGVFLIWRTLEATKRAAVAAEGAVTEAKNATKAAQEAVNVTRDIGRAQVRAYVTIKSAAIYFGGDDGGPFIQIVAANSGQSPARSFVWVPEIRYLADVEADIRKAPDQDWLRDYGVDIASHGELEPLYVPDGFGLVTQVSKYRLMPDKVGISVTIHYAWLDVFEGVAIDFASFAGVADIGDADENVREIHPLNTSKWYCKLHPVAKGQVGNWIGVAARDKKPETKGA